jgi:hypothetical protein
MDKLVCAEDGGLGQREDAHLTRRLQELYVESGVRDGSPPNAVAVWKAIERVATRNKGCAERGLAPYPMPDWVNDYLLQSADKISRLWLGIRPADNRPLWRGVGQDLGSIAFHKKDSKDLIGYLRGNKKDGKPDTRVEHVAAALGFAGGGEGGWSAFKRHDRAARDTQYLAIYDHRDLDTAEARVRRDVRETLCNTIKKNPNERLSTDQTIRNRLSAARRARPKT